MLNSVFGTIGIYVFIGVCCAVWMMRFVRSSYRPSIWFALSAFLTFVLLWPAIVSCAVWYGITYMNRLRSGRPVSYTVESQLV